MRGERAGRGGRRDKINKNKITIEKTLLSTITNTLIRLPSKMQHKKPENSLKIFAITKMVFETKNMATAYFLAAFPS